MFKLFLPFLSLLFHSTLLLSLVGRIRDKENGNAGGPVDKLKKNGLITVELDLRPEGERSMRFFVNGKQQKVRVVGLPQTVEFAVCILLFCYR